MTTNRNSNQPNPHTQHLHSTHPDNPENHNKILIVDDDQMILTALTLTLERHGYDICSAKDGYEAIECMNHSPPAILICDQRMPGLTGIEVMIQAQQICPETIRILLTAFSDRESVINAINIGQVNHYITKPWEEAQLVRIIENSLEKYKLVKENKSLHDLILLQHKELTKAHESLSHDLQIGARIHEKILLSTVPKNIPGVVIDALSIPSKEIDGDFFEFYCPTDDWFDIVIGDVMGKGLPAAIVGLSVKTYLSRFALPFPLTQTFRKETGWYTNAYSPSEIVALTHREVTPKLINLEYFVSLFYARFNLRYKTLSYVDCGSTKPLHYKAKENTITQLNGNNFPLGVDEHALYESIETTFLEGDVFIFYSDGVTEAHSKKNELFGIERLSNLILNNHDLRAPKLLALIRQATMNFMENDKPNDDLTLIVIKIGYNNRIDYAEESSSEFCCDLAQLEAVRGFVHRLCQKAPGDTQRLSQEMQLIVDEAFCNIVKHGNKNKRAHPIRINGIIKDDGIFFELCDKGDSFEPSDVNEPSFSGNCDTGYGWHIIREIATEVTYFKKETLQGWNHLCLYKRFYRGEHKMKFSYKIEGKVLVVTPEGESLDARGAPIFRENVLELINTNNFECVVIDLNNLQFIDSSGLGSFLSILRVLNSRGGDLKLCQMNRTIRTMFELVKMHKIFEIFNSSEDAVRSFKLVDHV